MTKKLVLLVEDDYDTRLALTDFIKLDGFYDVVALEDAHEAFQWLAHHERPDFVLTDFKMFGGGEVIALAVSKLGIPVLMISSAPDEAVTTLREVGLRIPVLDKSKCNYALMKIIDKMIGSPVKISA